MNYRAFSRHQRRENRAFTMKEMLCALAVVFLIVTVQFSVLGNGEIASDAARCRDNLRQLILAWQMYSSDNAGGIAPNNGDVGRGSPGQQSWVTGWLDFTSSLDNINTDLLIGFQKNGYYGHLGPYLKGAEVFRCPADSSQVTIFGRRQNRVRSVAMNNWMGGSSYSGQTAYRMFQKQSDIVGLPPADLWVIQDEREDSINDSELIVDMHSGEYAQIVDYPGSYHQGGGQLSFADGHVEQHVWQDKRTNPELIKGQLIPLGVPSPNNRDIEWLQARTTIAN